MGWTGMVDGVDEDGGWRTRMVGTEVGRPSSESDVRVTCGSLRHIMPQAFRDRNNRLFTHQQRMRRTTSHLQSFILRRLRYSLPLTPPAFPNMPARHRSHHSASMRSSRPESRASTTTATSEHPDTHPTHFHANDPEAALLAHLAPHPTASPFTFPQHATLPSFDAHEAAYAASSAAGYNSATLTADAHDDKRRKAPSVTASNDRELREMLARNEGRPLHDVAAEVIAKERTTMAEKTKQLFAMLW